MTDAIENPEEMLGDIRARHYHSTGEPPRRVYANGGFRGLFYDHMHMKMHVQYSYAHVNEWEPKCLEGADFMYMGMLVYCTLKTKHTTLLAVAE